MRCHLSQLSQTSFSGFSVRLHDQGGGDVCLNMPRALMGFLRIIMLLSNFFADNHEKKKEKMGCMLDFYTTFAPDFSN